MSFIAAYILGVLIVGNLLYIWFNTSLCVYATKALRWLGWKKNAVGFWPDAETYDTWLKQEWQTWSATSFPGWLSHLLGCPGCLGTHLSWIVGVVLACNGAPVSIIFAGFFSWPLLAAWLRNQVTLK